MFNSIPRLKALALAAVLMPFAMVAAAAALRDEDLARALEGAWCNSLDGGKTCWGYDEFKAGSIRSCGRLPENGIVITAEARYEVKGNRVCHVVTAASRSFALPIGERFCVEVLDITERFQRFRSLETDHIDVIYRVAPEAVRCPREEALTPNSRLLSDACGSALLRRASFSARSREVRWQL